MPISHSLSKANNLIYTRYTARITLQDVDMIYPQIFREIANWGTATELADLSAVEAIDMSVQTIRDIAERIAIRRRALNLEGSKVIISTDDIVFGLARVYSAHAAFVGGLDIQIVRSFAEAKLYLRLPDHIIDPMIRAAK